MDLKLKDKVVLVTGGYRGLGKSICLMLAGEGAKVGINHRHSPDHTEAIVEEIGRNFGSQAAAIRGDISEENDVVAMFDQVEQLLGPVDALVNNAAFCPVGSTAELSVEDFTYALQVNLT